MDSLITAVARWRRQALAAGDPLGALKRVAPRDDAPALARFERPGLANNRPSTRRGPRFEAHGNRINAAHARYLEVRRLRTEAAYGPFAGAQSVYGVTHDGQNIWFASGEKLKAFDPASGKAVRSIDVAAHAGTAFDGRHLFQLAEDRIQKIDPKSGRVLTTIPAPGGGGDSGLTWAEGTLWVGQYRARRIHQVDPETGAILRKIESNRFVTGATWVDGELWHGTWEGDESDVRRVDPRTGAVQETLEMPPGASVSGLESDGGDQFFCGGGRSGKVRVVRRPRRRPGAGGGPEGSSDSASR